MKKLLFSLFFTFLVFVQACDKENEVEPVTITANSLSVSIAENSSSGSLLGTLSASASDGSDITYSIISQNVSGALSLNSSNGELTIEDAAAFDFETNTTITASYTATNGTEEATGDITISITDIAVTANNFMATIDERPGDAVLLGSITASISDGSALTYSLSNENVQGALALNGSTGELTVANANDFVFATNPTITARYTASNGTEEASGDITIAVGDVVVNATAFTAEVSENPTNSAVIGTVSASSSNNAALSYSIDDVSPAGAIALNTNTGELTVADASVFDFETNTSVTAKYTASNGTEEATSNVAITIIDVTVTANELMTSIDENPTAGDVIGSLTATASDGSGITYSLASQEIANAFDLNTSTGELTVKDASVFDFETNPSISGSYFAVSGEESSAQTDFTITLNDVTVSADAFTVTIDENPTAGQLLGTFSASASNGADLVYALASESVTGAFSINANTGELKVADVAAFDYEANTSVTATYTATSGTEEATADITIALNDLDDVPETPMIVKIFAPTNNYKARFRSVLSTNNYEHRYTVDWGDGTVTAHFANAAEHTYTSAGEYTITISGKMPSILFEEIGSALESVEQWGSMKFIDMGFAFRYCSNLVINATDMPNFSQIQNVQNMFDGAKVSGNLANWDLSNATEFMQMFREANFDNANISGWKISGDASFMFYRASNFNEDIGDWDVSGVTNMKGMFIDASAFNQDIDSWNVSNVITMEGMFQAAFSFNQDLNSWDVSNVTNMMNMFRAIQVFNGNISAWQVGKVTNMSSMFNGCEAFNQDLSGWDTGFCLSMANMFNRATLFSQNLSSWNVSRTTGCTGFGLNSGLTIDQYPNFTKCTP